MAIKVGHTFETPQGHTVEVYEIDWARKVARLKYIAGTPNQLGGKYAGSMRIHGNDFDTDSKFATGLFSEEELDDFVDDPHDYIISPTEYADAAMGKPEEEYIEIGEQNVPRGAMELMAEMEYQAVERLKKQRFKPEKGTPRYYKALDKETLELIEEYGKKEDANPKYKKVLDSLVSLKVFPRGKVVDERLLFVDKQKRDYYTPPEPQEKRQSRRDRSWGMPDPFRGDNADAFQEHRAEVAELKAKREAEKLAEAEAVRKLREEQEAAGIEIRD